MLALKENNQMQKSIFIKLALLTAVATGTLVVAASIPTTASADGDTDFVCWDLDNGETECESFDQMAIECKGYMDVYPCSDIDWNSVVRGRNLSFRRATPRTTPRAPRFVFKGRPAIQIRRR